mmetsp:Transcript_27572/g.66274  ORF Transcript_27572/g.66274 Transcript_27572/m.66274 type:complete len:986 (-) Transcript_27572:1744-4701(-)
MLPTTVTTTTATATATSTPCRIRRLLYSSAVVCFLNCLVIMSSLNQHQTSEDIKHSIRVRSLSEFVTTTKTTRSKQTNSNNKDDGYDYYGERRSSTEFVTAEETPQSTFGAAGGSIAIVRPFAPHDAQELYLSFQEWDKYFPCEIDPANASQLVPKMDLVLSFSQTLSDHPETDLVVQKTKEVFDAKQGWSRCFRNLIIHEAHIHHSQDIYDKNPRKKLKPPEWVVGPNLQFQRVYNAVNDAARYETMIIMEKDTMPRAVNWTNRMLDEIDSRRPFAVLGSKYCGNSWDGHRSNLPIALLEHLNGNAVYNLTHPYLRLMVKEMQDENDTPLKSVPYDVRMSQIVVEGSMGIPPDLPTNRSVGWGSVNVDVDRVVVDTEKSYKLRTWWDNYGAIENPMKETRAIRNMHLNDYLPRHVRNGIIVHGTREYSSWNPEKNKIGLVVSGWGDASLPNELTQSFSSSRHPFTEFVVMQDYNGTIKIEQGLRIPTWRMVRTESSDISFDLCEAPVNSKWFMLTNLYHKLAPSVDLMLTRGSNKKPLIHYTSAYHCSQDPQCKLILEDARRFYPSLDKVVLDFDMIYHEETRNLFCQAWKEAAENITTASTDSRPLMGPTAASYVAFMYSQNWADCLYSFSDKSIHGSYDAFIRMNSRASSTTDVHHSKPIHLNIRNHETTINEPAIVSSEDDDAYRRRYARKKWKEWEKSIHPDDFLISCNDIGNIRLIKRLGEGKRKITDQGKWNDSDVVVKHLRLEKRTTEKDRDASDRFFMREVLTLHQLRNAPNVMQILGWCNNTMVVDGVMMRSLVDLLQDAQVHGMTTRRKLEMSLDVARAIQEVHKLGLVHNDIKPIHFLVNDAGKIFLDDFDQVVFPNAGKPGNRFSTNQFRPPEEYAGKAKDLSADIYVVSLILWSIWSSQEFPYGALDWDDNKCREVGAGRLRPELTALKECPEPLKQLMVQAWDHDPQQRPTAAELVSNLEWMMDKNAPIL